MLCIKTVGRTVDDMLLKCPTGMKAALGENPKRFYGQTRGKAPMTRMGSAAIIRNALLRARHYLEKAGAALDDSRDLPDADLGLIGLARVLKHEIPLRIHAHRADDIVTGVRIAEEFDIDYSIEHCTDGAAIADFLGRRRAAVNLGPLLCMRPKPEMAALSFASAAILAGHQLFADRKLAPVRLCQRVLLISGLDRKKERILRGGFGGGYDVVPVANWLHLYIQAVRAEFVGHKPRNWRFIAADAWNGYHVAQDLRCARQCSR